MSIATSLLIVEPPATAGDDQAGSGTLIPTGDVPPSEPARAGARARRDARQRRRTRPLTAFSAALRAGGGCRPAAGARRRARRPGDVAVLRLPNARHDVDGEAERPVLAVTAHRCGWSRSATAGSSPTTDGSTRRGRCARHRADRRRRPRRAADPASRSPRRPVGLARRDAAALRRLVDRRRRRLHGAQPRPRHRRSPAARQRRLGVRCGAGQRCEHGDHRFVHPSRRSWSSCSRPGGVRRRARRSGPRARAVRRDPRNRRARAEPAPDRAHRRAAQRRGVRRAARCSARARRGAVTVTVASDDGWSLRRRARRASGCPPRTSSRSSQTRGLDAATTRWRRAVRAPSRLLPLAEPTRRGPLMAAEDRPLHRCAPACCRR